MKKGEEGKWREKYEKFMFYILHDFHLVFCLLPSNILYREDIGCNDFDMQEEISVKNLYP